MQSVRTLFAELIDYAGLFPPASLGMAATVTNYAEYVRADSNWMLGRLIVPAARLDEFETVAHDLLPRDENAMPWMLSALLPREDESDHGAIFDRILRFNECHSAPARGLALIDVVETRFDSARTLDRVIDLIPDELTPFFEIPAAGDARGMIAALAGTPGRAKIRTGGVTADLIPDTRDVIAFLRACSAARVAFKATAGLHHALRAERPLTYEPESPRGFMHGFINVFLVAAAIRADLVTDAVAASMLDETNSAAFTFTDTGVAYGDVTLDNEYLALAREEFALSFGSCSFEEPVGDLRELALL